MNPVSYVLLKTRWGSPGCPCCCRSIVPQIEPSVEEEA